MAETAVGLIIEIGPKVVGYILDVKEGPRERQELLAELLNITGVLTTAKNAFNFAGDHKWPSTPDDDVALKSTLDEALSIIKQLQEQLSKERGIRGIKKALRWPLDKKDTQANIKRLSRCKTGIMLWFQAQCFKDDVNNAKELESIRRKQSAILNRQEEALVILTGFQDAAESQRIQAILSWISPLDHEKKHKQVFKTCLEGTARWLLSEPYFEKWYSNDESTLFLHGGPGVGKTILVSVVIEFLASKISAIDSAALLYLYLDHKQRQEQSYRALASSLVKQLLLRKPLVPQKLEALYEKHRMSGGRPDVAEMEEVLIALVNDLDSCIFVIDALDESESNSTDESQFRSTQDEILRLLIKLRDTNCNLKVMITARTPLDNVQDQGVVELHQLFARELDIKQYLVHRFSSRTAKFQRVVKNTDGLQEQAISTILNRCQGMFLLARLYMDSLDPSRTRTEFDKQLSSLPLGLEGLSNTYSQAMERIKSQESSDAYWAQRILAWLCFSSRPLKINELQHALAIDPDSTEIDFNDQRLLFSEEIVSLCTENCAGLVLIDASTEEIRLVHYTTQEFFNQKKDELFPWAKQVIAASCIKYLSYKRFSYPFKNNLERTRIIEENPFFVYAVYNLGIHTYDIEASLVEKLADLILMRRNMATFNQCRPWAFGRPDMLGLDPDVIILSPISLAIQYKLLFLIPILIERGSSVHEGGYLNWIPLQEAGYHGLPAAMKLLLDMGANPEIRDHIGNTALQAAALSDNIGITQRIATEYPHIINLQNSSGNTALHDAASRGKVEVSQCLLKAGANPFITNSSNLWPICTTPDVRIVKALFPYHRGKFELQDPYGSSILHVLAIVNSKEEIKEVLDTCPSLLDRVDRNGKTALYHAVEKQHYDVFNILMSYKPRLDIVDQKGRTVLAYAVGHGSPAITKRLLEAGADPALGKPERDDESRAIAWYASLNGPECMRLLLQDKRFNYATIDNIGMSALHQALWSNQWETAKLILAHDQAHGNKFKDLQNSRGSTPLMLASDPGSNLEMVKLLVAAGYSTILGDEKGRTALDRAREAGHADIVDFLSRQPGSA